MCIRDSLLQRINEAVRAVLLSSALGADLDQVAGNFDTERLLITEATDEADAVYESDEALRGRTLLSWAVSYTHLTLPTKA